MTASLPPIGVFGAGAVGGYLGVLLASAGVPVVLLGRQPLLDRAGELVAEPHAGDRRRPSAPVTVALEPEALADCALVLVTVKSRDTAEAGRQLARILPAGVPVVSFQNGLHNRDILAEALGRERTLAGVVTYNVVQAEGRFQRASGGPLFVESSNDPRVAELVRALESTGESVDTREDIDAVMRGKLLLNLNNAICAALGSNIATMLKSREARWCFSRCLREGLTVMERSGLSAHSPIPLPLAVVARALLLPNVLLLPLARKLTQVHPDARSSTLQDIHRGRPTEVRELNGEIVAMGERVGMPCPANAELVAIVESLAADASQGRQVAYLTPAQLRTRIQRRLV